MTRLEQYYWLKDWFNDHRGQMHNQPSMVSAIRANATARKCVRELYFALKNETLGGCSSCEADALLFLMMKSTEETMKKIADCKFKLKQGVLLQGAKGLHMVTCANLTDDLAIAYLKDNPKRAQMFEFIPDGWDAEPVTEVENNEQGAERAETSQISPEKTAEVQEDANKEKGAQNENNAENSAPAEEKPKRTRKPRTTKK